MNRAPEVVSRIEELGGYLALDADGSIRYRVPKDSPEARGREDVADLLDELRAHKDEVVLLLREREQLPVSDLYAERMRAAFRQINAPDYPAGMVPWLDTVRPDLYQELTARLPDEIQRLWSERGPLGQFESVLARLVSLHRRCCEMHRAESTR